MSLLVELAMNNPDNGAPMGRAEAMVVRVAGDYLCFDVGGDGPACRRLSGNRLRLGRHVYRYEWFSPGGNWCWDAFIFSHEEGQRLVRNAARSGWWYPIDGAARLWESWRRAEKSA